MRETLVDEQLGAVIGEQLELMGSFLRARRLALVLEPSTATPDPPKVSCRDIDPLALPSGELAARSGRSGGDRGDRTG